MQRSMQKFFPSTRVAGGGIGRGVLLVTLGVAALAGTSGCLQRKSAASGAPVHTAAPPTPPPNDPNVALAAKDPPLAGVFTDAFDGSALGSEWRSTAPAGTYRIVGGALEVHDAFNHPLWLARKIPRDATIDFDAWSESGDGDIKAEVWGDGHTYSTEPEYVASSYVFILGGWHDTISVIARMAEHGLDRKQTTQFHVAPGRHYHFRISRHGGHIDWFVDGTPFLSYDDDQPLAGAGHDHFAFNDWQADVFFDNLRIAPYAPDTTLQP